MPLRENITAITALIGEIVALIGVLAPLLMQQSKIKKGTLCQLRTEMLRIYYRHCETQQIRQYEYENFVMLYEAYKALKGNSFVDKIYKEIQDLEIVS
jgi:hypothetical protein